MHFKGVVTSTFYTKMFREIIFRAVFILCVYVVAVVCKTQCALILRCFLFKATSQIWVSDSYKSTEFSDVTAAWLPRSLLHTDQLEVLFRHRAVRVCLFQHARESNTSGVAKSQ